MATYRIADAFPVVSPFGRARRHGLGGRPQRRAFLLSTTSRHFSCCRSWSPTSSRTAAAPPTRRSLVSGPWCTPKRPGPCVLLSTHAPGAGGLANRQAARSTTAGWCSGQHVWLITKRPQVQILLPLSAAQPSPRPVRRFCWLSTGPPSWRSWRPRQSWWRLGRS